MAFKKNSLEGKKCSALQPCMLFTVIAALIVSGLVSWSITGQLTSRLPTSTPSTSTTTCGSLPDLVISNAEIVNNQLKITVKNQGDVAASFSTASLFIDIPWLCTFDAQGCRNTGCPGKCQMWQTTGGDSHCTCQMGTGQSCLAAQTFNVAAGASVTVTVPNVKPPATPTEIQIHLSPPGLNEISTTNNKYSQTFTKTSSSAAAPCTGTTALSLSPSTVYRGNMSSATVSGLSWCSGKTISLKKDSCAGSVLASFSSGSTGGTKAFQAPATPGAYSIYACIDKNADADFADAGESASAVLTVT